MTVCMKLKRTIKRFHARIRDITIRGEPKETKRVLKISAPFDFVKEETLLPGFTKEDMMILRDKAMTPRHMKELIPDKLTDAEKPHTGSDPFCVPRTPPGQESSSSSVIGSPIKIGSAF